MFFSPGLDPGTCRGATVTLDGAEAHHAVRVMRLKVGEELSVSDGHGFVAYGRVASIDGERLVMVVDDTRYEPPPATRLVLVQALAKGDRDLQAIEAATEIGVDEVVPWSAERSVVVWREGRADKALRKWRSTLLTSSKQSRRARQPSLGEPVTSRQLAASIGADPDTVAIVLHEDAADSLASIARSVDAGKAIMLIVGPEGGIAERELDMLTAAGARAARIGPHVLRSSTAGPVALSVVQTARGAWDRA
nr:16S rRNA (uracil(1498)-N(3))-methyltransferase [Spelaeicoccus albus]